MTLQTWKDEFFPVKPSKRMTKRQAIEHSLLKWQGLTKANLKKHKVVRYGNEMGDSENHLTIASSSCALCVKYIDENNSDFNNGLEGCHKCPLAKSLGRPCDRGEDPYGHFIQSGDPKPMIKALKALLEEK